MIMFPHTVTIYNTETEENPDSNFSPVVKYHITILRGVLLDASKAANISKSGLDSADSANLYIPVSVKAVDGITGSEKRYVGPTEFWPSEDKSGLWTISDSGNTLFVKGEIAHPELTVQALKASYDDVYNVTRVDFKDFGGDMSHWEVGGS